MRKAIAVSAVLTLLVSLVLTGCSQDAGSDAGINSRDSSIINEAISSAGSTGDIVSSADDTAETKNTDQKIQN